MKLHSITLDGFWGYREGVRVEIAGLPMLVAVGHNGSGKSALVVHAISAGLYGKFPTRTVEESITVGASTGAVIIEFEVGGSIYRVARSHPRSGAATASVHRVTADGDWESLTEKGVREATVKVTELLGMDHDTAIMTWIAQQGEYGAFANAQPSARFKMLATVFDLAKYGPLHRAAQDQLRKAKDAASVAEGRVAELNDGLIDDDARAEDEMTDDALAAAAASAHAAFDEASAALAAHQQHDPQIAVGHARTALAAVKGVRLERLRAAEQTLAELRANRDAAPGKLDAAINIVRGTYSRESGFAAEQAERARVSLAQRIEEAEAELGFITQTAANLPGMHAKATAAQAAVTAAESEVGRLISESARAHDRVRDAQSALRSARETVAEAQDALDALAHAGDCYACGQHISEQVAATLRASQEAVLAEREMSVSAAVTALTIAERAAEDMETAEDNARRALVENQQALNSIRIEVEAAELNINGAERTRAALAQDHERLAELDQEHAATLERLVAERDEALASATATHNAQLAEIATRGKEAAQAVSALRRPSAEEEQLERDYTAAENLALGDSRYAEETARLIAARDAARATATGHDAEIGRRAEVARRQAEHATRITEAKAQLAAAQNDVTVYTDLVAAYAPGGIPSMVLETVIGDLNDAINVTLNDLAGGELEVRLSTSRETSGGTAESKVTVYVDTPTGPRSYEALSGGQRFRVDLAIRMGLAAIIARGTGTPIETFILDEGWGSLDESGIRSTLEVLGRLSEQTNVLTVSHIDSVKEAFPARIEVTTNEGTSAAEVIR